MDAENLAPTGFRSPDRSARSESLYRLSYPGPHTSIFITFTKYRHLCLMYKLFQYVVQNYTRVNSVKNITPTLKWICEGLTYNFSPFSVEICTLVTLRQKRNFVQSGCNWKWARQSCQLLWYLRFVPLHETCSTGKFTGEVTVFEF